MTPTERAVAAEIGREDAQLDKTPAELQMEKLDAMLAALPSNIKAEDEASLAEMLAIPYPIKKRGEVFYVRYLSMTRLLELSMAFKEFSEAFSAMGVPETVKYLGLIGQQFLLKPVSPLEFRPCEAKEIADVYSPREFIDFAQDYLFENGIGEGSKPKEGDGSPNA